MPRWFGIIPSASPKLSLHVFCDASGVAYATCIFLRVKYDDTVVVNLVQARTRVAPVKKITIPRLELLACCIGSRLANGVRQDLGISLVPTYYWTDSTTALCWIRRNEQWRVFVWNRVQEIISLSNPEQWRHLPGQANPADLPSRGCTAAKLLELRWWEGPEWLRLEEASWPNNSVEPDEEAVSAEKRKVTLSTLSLATPPSDWYYKRFSSVTKIIRLIAWVFRFVYNAKKGPAERTFGELSASEISKAENTLYRLIQQDVFKGQEEESFGTLGPKYIMEGVLRLKTNLILRKDTRDFRYPVILPSNHPVVYRLIMDVHRKLCHAGVQVLLANLRERYWILKSRRTIKKVLRSCVRCFQVKHAVIAAPLPENRIKDAAIFEIIGIDLTGPLFLRGGQKAWIVLFTCAIYRSVHLELVISLSTSAFLLALRRFIARRGRPVIVYTDNGTNFLGASNSFKSIDWSVVSSQTSLQPISWIFNPPTAAWWGGWWERLIGMLKQLLRRVLGRASLTYEELVTVLCDCESVMNSRPLSYISEDTEDLRPLTPAMFLQEMRECGVPEMDILDSRDINKRIRHRQTVIDHLRKRFRSEYLGQLRQGLKKKASANNLTVGDIVLVGDDSRKRIDWPLAIVKEVFPGKDNNVRVARVKMASGTVLRPVQRLYPLEVSDHIGIKHLLTKELTGGNDHSVQEKDPVTPEADQETPDLAPVTPDNVVIKTRCGRTVKPPQRLSYP